MSLNSPSLIRGEDTILLVRFFNAVFVFMFDDFRLFEFEDDEGVARPSFSLIELPIKFRGFDSFLFKW